MPKFKGGCEQLNAGQGSSTKMKQEYFMEQFEVLYLRERLWVSVGGL